MIYIETRSLPHIRTRNISKNKNENKFPKSNKNYDLTMYCKAGEFSDLLENINQQIIQESARLIIDKCSNKNKRKNYNYCYFKEIEANNYFDKILNEVYRKVEIRTSLNKLISEDLVVSLIKQELMNQFNLNNDHKKEKKEKLNDITIKKDLILPKIEEKKFNNSFDKNFIQQKIKQEILFKTDSKFNTSSENHFDEDKLENDIIIRKINKTGRNNNYNNNNINIIDNKEIRNKSNELIKEESKTITSDHEESKKITKLNYNDSSSHVKLKNNNNSSFFKYEQKRENEEMIMINLNNINNKHSPKIKTNNKKDFKHHNISQNELQYFESQDDNNPIEHIEKDDKNMLLHIDFKTLDKKDFSKSLSKFKHISNPKESSEDPNYDKKNNIKIYSKILKENKNKQLSSNEFKTEKEKDNKKYYEPIDDLKKSRKDSINKSYLYVNNKDDSESSQNINRKNIKDSIVTNNKQLKSKMYTDSTNGKNSFNYESDENPNDYIINKSDIKNHKKNKSTEKDNSSYNSNKNARLDAIERIKKAINKLSRPNSNSSLSNKGYGNTLYNSELFKPMITQSSRGFNFSDEDKRKTLTHIIEKLGKTYTSLDVNNKSKTNKKHHRQISQLSKNTQIDNEIENNSFHSSEYSNDNDEKLNDRQENNSNYKDVVELQNFNNQKEKTSHNTIKIKSKETIDDSSLARIKIKEDNSPGKYKKGNTKNSMDTKVKTDSINNKNKNKLINQSNNYSNNSKNSKIHNKNKQTNAISSNTTEYINTTTKIESKNASNIKMNTSDNIEGNVNTERTVETNNSYNREYDSKDYNNKIEQNKKISNNENKAIAARIRKTVTLVQSLHRKDSVNLNSIDFDSNKDKKIDNKGQSISSRLNSQKDSIPNIKNDTLVNENKTNDLDETKKKKK